MRSTHKPFQPDRSNVLHFMSNSETRWRIDLLRAVTALATPPASGGDEPPQDPPNGPPDSLVPTLTQAASALDCMATLAEHVRGARYAEGRAQASPPEIDTELEEAMLGAVCALGRYVEAAVGDMLRGADEVARA